MAPLDARIHSQEDAHSSLVVKGSREHSWDAKVVGLVEHAECMEAEHLPGALFSI